jgi:hypothetical protein
MWNTGAVPIAVELKRVDHMLMGPGKPWISERLLWWALNEKDHGDLLIELKITQTGPGPIRRIAVSQRS